jgi:hypothetical protein
VKPINVIEGQRQHDNQNQQDQIDIHTQPPGSNLASGT